MVDIRSNPLEISCIISSLNSNAVLYLRMKTLELSDQILGLGTLQVSVVDCFILLNKATGATG